MGKEGGGKFLRENIPSCPDLKKLWVEKEHQERGGWGHTFFRTPVVEIRSVPEVGGEYTGERKALKRNEGGCRIRAIFLRRIEG